MMSNDVFVIKMKACILFELLKLNQCLVFFINYIYLLLNQAQTLNQPGILLCKQTNKQTIKQNKIV